MQTLNPYELSLIKHSLVRTINDLGTDKKYENERQDCVDVLIKVEVMLSITRKNDTEVNIFYK